MEVLLRKTGPILGALAAAAAASLLGAGCGPGPGDGVGAAAQPLASGNGLSLNGLSLNGLSPKGLSFNALSENGLSPTGLAAPEFRDWFAADPENRAVTMQYLVRCALGKGKTLSYDAGDAVYTWTGNLGLASAWAHGHHIPLVEQQLVSACLAAHANRYGLEVEISIRGQGADGYTPLPLDPGEQWSFSRPEGCFFGNLFDDTGVFDGAVYSAWAPDETNPRGCAVEGGRAGLCPPLQHLGACSDICTTGRSGRRDRRDPRIYSHCVANGVRFPALTTFLDSSEVYACGDGVCQFTESPYDPATRTGCASDCGIR